MLELLGRADGDVAWSLSGDARLFLDESSELDEQQIIEMASNLRLDVAASNMVVQARAANVDLEEGNRNPDLNLGVGYQKNFSNRDGMFPSVGITPKIFDDNSAQVAKAESEFRQAIIEADRVRQAAITEARVAWVLLQAQLEVVEAYETNILSLAQSNVELATIAFDAGETDLTVLLEAQRRINDARIELVDRQYASSRIYIEVERAVGGSLDASLLEVATMTMSGEPDEVSRRMEESR